MTLGRRSRITSLLERKGLSEALKITLLGFALGALYVSLFLLRSYERNKFLSWSEVFNIANIYFVLLLLGIALYLGHILSTIELRYSGRPEVFIFPLFLLVSVLFYGNPEVNPDAGRYFSEAKYLEVEGVEAFIREWGRKLYIYVDQPVVPFIYGVIFKIFGEKRLYLQVYNSVLFALSACLLYRIATRLWGEKAGVSSAFLLLASPYLLVQVPLTLVDVSLMFFVVLLVYSLLRALGDEGKTWVGLSAVCIFLVVFSKLTAILFLIVLPATVLAMHVKGILVPGWKQRMVGIGALTAVFFTPALLALGKTVAAQYETSMILRGRLSEWAGTESTFSLLLYQFSAPVTALATYSAYTAMRKRDKLIVLPLLWFLFPLLFLHDTRIRYMIPAFPALALLAGIAVASIERRRGRFLLFALVSISLITAFFAYNPFLQVNSANDLRRAAEYAENVPVESIEVYAVQPGNYPYSLTPLIPVFDLHSSKRIILRGEDSFPTRKITPENRFVSWTWTYEPPGYYFPLESSRLIAVISPLRYDALPVHLKKKLEDYILLRSFESGTYAALYPYKVRLYLRNPELVVLQPEKGLTRGEEVRIKWRVEYPLPEELMYRVYIYSRSRGVYELINSTWNTSITWRVPSLPPGEDYVLRVYASRDNWQSYVWNETGFFTVM